MSCLGISVMLPDSFCYVTMHYIRRGTTIWTMLLTQLLLSALSSVVIINREDAAFLGPTKNTGNLAAVLAEQ